MFFLPYGTAEKPGRIHFPVINVTLVVVNVLVFLVELTVLAHSGPTGFQNFITAHAFVPSSLHHSWLQPSLVAALFLHASLLHIVGNMLYLLPFGDNVEDRLGSARYLLFYLICGIGANLVYAVFNRHSMVPVLGASGAIAGVLGGYLALHPWGSQVKGIFLLIIIPLFIRLPAILFIGYWFILQLFSTVATLGQAQVQSTGGVAFMAHVAGFLIGLGLAPLLAKPVIKPQTSQLA